MTDEVKVYDESKCAFSIASLVLGVLGICSFTIIPSILAIVFGAIAMNKKEGVKGFSIAGIVLGIVAIVLAILLIVFILAFTVALIPLLEESAAVL
ncbi:MAG TPA: DUF4190 domain-containing protein [Methanocorpusculum sp.]|nr:DUF4190 domain-containing protein [Methanocorpusculum sp.]